MPDFIPPSDADFDAWLTNFVDYVVANAVALGATPAQVKQSRRIGTQGIRPALPHKQRLRQQCKPRAIRAARRKISSVLLWACCSRIRE